MASHKESKSWAEQFAELDDPTPKDFDPEDIIASRNDDAKSSAEESDPEEAREHYEEVGKSKLRQPEAVDLGPRYTGSRISRDALDGEESDDDRFRKSSGDDVSEDEDSGAEEDIEDEERANQEMIDGHRTKKIGILDHRKVTTRSKESRNNNRDEEGDEAMNEVPDEGFESDEDGRSTDIEMQNDNEDAQSTSTNTTASAHTSPDSSRAALRKLMAESHSTVSAHLSQTAKADLAKGRAISHQQTTFDTFLNTRIHLQKALLASNALARASSPTKPPHAAETIQAAETAALNLWSNLNSLRSSLHPSTAEDPPLNATPSTPPEALWTAMQSHETHFLPTRRSTLEKWSQKTTQAPLQRRDKFSQPSTQQSITSVIDAHLSGPLFKKTLARSRDREAADPGVQETTGQDGSYNDTDFYALLLRELVERRMNASSSSYKNTTLLSDLPRLPPANEWKVRKNVDRKASKGRKMRYQVHEKLVGFMATEDRGMWGEGRRGELFGGLLGRRVDMGEGVEGLREVEVDGDGGDGVGEEGEGLRLFV